MKLKLLRCCRPTSVFLLLLLFLMTVLLVGCGSGAGQAEGQTAIVATTYPVYYLTHQLVDGVPELTVSSLVCEPVSCLHEYTITTGQMKLLDRADTVVLSGAGMEEFLESALEYVPEEHCIDASSGLALLPGEEDEYDPHVWLSPLMYSEMCANIADGLVQRYPAYEAEIRANQAELQTNLQGLQLELTTQLEGLSCRELITFHDGFAYFAQAFDLTIAAAVEEEEGAETPARELHALCTLVEDSGIPAIFTERNGSTNASGIISQETGVPVYVLNTMMDGETDYFTAMRENVQAVREALS